jgi:hypothetical protein
VRGDARRRRAHRGPRGRPHRRAAPARAHEAGRGAGRGPRPRLRRSR